jgi:hypothetical protein
MGFPLGRVVYDRHQVLQLAPPGVMGTFGGANAAKVEPHRAPTALHKGAGKRLHHLVVHGSGKQGMWMRNDCHSTRLRPDSQAWQIFQGLNEANGALQGKSAGLSVHALAPQMGGRQQALHHLAIFQVRLDNFVNILLVDIRVPHALRVNHRHGAGGTAVQAAGLVDAHLTRASQSSFFHTLFAAVKTGLGLVLCAAGFAVLALVETEKNVMRVVRR